MALSFNKPRWSSSLVTKLSLIILALLVTGIGLAGTAYVLRYLQERLVVHGIEHNRAVATRLETLLTADLESKTLLSSPALQGVVGAQETFGYRVFIVDQAQGMLVADSGRAGELPIPTRNSWLSATTDISGRQPLPKLHPGPAFTDDEQGRPMLLWMQESGMAGSDPGRWLLGVASDHRVLAEFLDDLHLHLDVVIIGTYMLLAILAYIAMRQLGRGYERRLESQVAQRSAELETAHDAMLASTRLATIGKTASVLTHEMRNPLASIKLGLAGLKGDNFTEREQRRITLITGEVDRLEALLTETLDYVRPIKISDRPQSLNDILNRVLQAQMPLIAQHQLAVKRVISPGCPAIHMDADKVHQVLLNLLKNAIEASPKQGEITLRLECEDQWLWLDVINSGEPMSPQVREQAFDPFFTTKAKGSGLGLGLVKRVIEEHGGHVHIDAEWDNGTCISIRLPIPAST